MKKWWLLLLFFPVLLLAEKNPPTGVPQESAVLTFSKGMYSYMSANDIPTGASAYIQNFNTDIEDAAVERNGYIRRDNTSLGGGASVTGLWRFFDTSGNEWIISYSSRTYYKNIVGGTPTAFGPNPTVAQVPVAAVNIGKIWFVD